MRYYEALDALKDKLTATLNDEGLVFTLKTDSYPITLTVSPNASPAAQMELFSVTDGDTSSDRARLQFIFKLDDLAIRVDDRLVISDALMNKIKGLAKKIHHAFLEGFFAERITYEATKTTKKDEPTEPLYTAPAQDKPDAFADFFDDHNPVTDLSKIPASEGQ
jgi:hypothetical protein